jgi:hypothetical protein
MRMTTLTRIQSINLTFPANVLILGVVNVSVPRPPHGLGEPRGGERPRQALGGQWSSQGPVRLSRAMSPMARVAVAQWTASSMQRQTRSLIS